VWNVTGADSGTFANVAFNGAEKLVGGGAFDIFKFFNGGSISGSINGGVGTNRLDYTGYTGGPVTINAQTSAASLIHRGVAGGFSNIGSLSGSPSTADSLTGPNQTVIWHLNGTNRGDIGGTFTFQGIENLVGGSGYDAFRFLGASSSVSGTIQGGGGGNRLDYSGYTGGPVAVNVQTGAASLIDGGAPGGFSGIGTTYGNPSTADSLTGPNQTVIWHLNGTNRGDIGGTFTFQGIENLVGGSGYDAFRFLGASPSVSGTIQGGGGGNRLDYSGYTGGTVTVNVQTGAASLVDGGAPGGFSGIGTTYGSPSTADSLTGPDATVIWHLNGTNRGDIGGTFTFQGIEKLVGGSANDTFRFAIGASESSTINGRAGTNTLDYSLLDAAHPVTVNLGTGAATATGGISNVQNVIGGAGDDNITGSTGNNVLLGGSGSDIISGGGGGNDVLVGGDGNDVLDATGSGRSILIGGLGSDQLTGGNLGDILIGGNTDWDATTAALHAILKEWTGADDYGTRISHLRNGGGHNGGYKFNSTTVHDDGNGDVLTGQLNADPDWFWANLPQDNLTDLEPGEQVN
jgi:hypothetical protein